VGGVLGVAFLISLAVIVFLFKQRRGFTGVTESTNRTEPKERDKTGEDIDIGGRLKANANVAEVGARLRSPDDNIASSGRLGRVY